MKWQLDRPCAVTWIAHDIGPDGRVRAGLALYPVNCRIRGRYWVARAYAPNGEKWRAEVDHSAASQACAMLKAAVMPYVSADVLRLLDNPPEGD